MKTAHTPGPWEIDLESVGIELPGHVPISSKFHTWFAQVVWKMDDDERSPRCEANARLIAAAPELLEALLDARHKLYGDGPGNPKIDAAIAKATQP